MGTYKWNKFCVAWMMLGCLLVVVVSATKNMPDDPRKLRNLFPLTLVHINDFHARFEETNLKSNNCTTTERSTVGCIAGISRVYTTIKRLLKEYQSKNAIYLNAGDNFQGTLWYNLLRWNVTASFIKKLRPAVMTLGNHEFDHGPKGLAPYLKTLNKANIPTAVANLELNGEKELKNSNIKKSVILQIDGRKIGVIGVLYDKTHTIAQTGNVTFSNAISAVKEQIAILCQRGITHIIVLSHCGLDEDKKLAAEAGDYIDLIVGAHSHSFLYSSDSKAPYDPKEDVIEGEYPVLVKSATSSKMTPIVQAKAFGKYVGRLTVYFDNHGNLKYWEGYPVYVDGSVQQDARIERDVKLWRRRVLELGSTVIGRTNVPLNRGSCRALECSLGSVVADSFSDQWTNSTFRPAAIVQAGNFRNPIYPGEITNGLIIEAAPFGSSVDLVRLRGTDIWAAAEHSFTWDDENRTNCLQVSGLRIRIDPSKPFYNRVVSIDVRDHSITDEEIYEPLDAATEYYVAVPSYLADGKDGFASMKNATSRLTGPLDSDAFAAYVAKLGVIDRVERGRVQVCGVNWDCDADVELPLNEDGTPI